MQNETLVSSPLVCHNPKLRRRPRICRRSCQPATMPRHGTHRARSSRWYLGLEALQVTPHRPLEPRLIYAGSVGTGWSIPLGRSIMAKLQRIAADASPFVAVPRADAKDARWTETEMVAEVEFTASTRDGRVRHPSFEGLREDRRAKAVRRERPDRNHCA